MLYTYQIRTLEENWIPITAQVNGAIAESGIQSGICVVYCPHTTAGITVNETTNPQVISDLLLAYRTAFPKQKAFQHQEGNSAAHAKASAVGNSVTLCVEQGRALLGPWQGIYLCEWNGPRIRTVYVKVIKE